jgi:anaerobic magnesium-protoporphyrin IX monomethyl ester cyclase
LLKVSLFYPPLVLPSLDTPYPSLPLLCAYLKENSSHEVSCIDLNVEFIHDLIKLSRRYGKKFRYPPAPRSATHDISRIRRFRAKPLFKKARDVVKRLLDRRYMSMDEVEYLTIEGLKLLFEDLSIDIETFRQLRSNDSETVSTHYLLDYWNLTHDQLNTIIEDNNGLSIFEFLGSEYFRETSENEPFVAGISVAFFTQFGAAISLAKHLKKLNPSTFVVIGGPVIRHVSRNFTTSINLFDVVDCFVETEGEDILVELLDRLEAGRDWRNTPGVIYRSHNDEVVKQPPQPYDVNKNSLPDYALIDQHTYREPQTLFLRTSKGCYWDKCAFCTQSLNTYQHRSIEHIAGDIQELAVRYGAKKIIFSDEAVALPRLSKLADVLIERDSPVEWVSYTRFDATVSDSVFAKLKRAGCAGLIFGLESACQRVNNLMNKGVNVENASKIIGACRKVDLFYGIGAIIGFPGETEAEMLETVDFLKKHLNGKKCWGYISIFSLNYGSRVFRHPEEFGITSIESAEEYIYKESYSFTCDNQVPYARMMEIRDML